MRFCVRQLDVCPGEEKRTLRKSAFCNPCRTEKRILAARSHGKTHSAGVALPKGALCATARAQTAPFREAQRTECTFPSRRRPEGGARQPPARMRGTMESGPTGQTRPSNPPARTRSGLRQVIPSSREVRTTAAYYHCALPLRTIVIASKHPKRAPALLLRVPQRSHVI